MKQYSHVKLSKKTIFVFRSKDEKRVSSTDPTETSLTIITTGTSIVSENHHFIKKGSNSL
ncbi:hypothetical protein ASU31_00385 [Pedobacter ginsenosidimutans]|uniref:Uncharacterized protein n=1 Tax=Pedobacter ginsenosidimutans TaxID=687842 RepID=A0A0T5VVK4_9SPHI|nr:hypothetical protein ASU31_00385 [Pedobacter ginsenosidimutans]